jgi:hypothetical protein
MTAFTVYAPHAIRHLRLPRPTLPNLRIAASVDVFTRSINRALAMAYVDPFKPARRQPETYVDAALEGRDPNW